MNWLKSTYSFNHRANLFYTIHTDSHFLNSFYFGNQISYLWEVSEWLNQHNIFPLLKIPNWVHTSTKDKLSYSNFQLNDNYITLHIRSIRRNPEKNLDFEKYIEVSHLIMTQLNMKVVILGKYDEQQFLVKNSTRDRKSKLIDLRNKLDHVWEVAYVMQNAFAHIGGDSGPTHLAAAVGTRVISVERNSNVAGAHDFGPFTAPGKLIKLTKQESTPANILKALNTFIENKETNSKPSITKKNLPRDSFKSFFISRHSKREYRDFEQFSSKKLFTSLSQNPSDERVIKIYTDLMKHKIQSSIYIPLRVNHLVPCIDILRELPIWGFSISQPFKIDILKYVDIIDKDVEEIGATNTVINKDGSWEAHNTDYKGAIQCLKKVTELQGKTALVFGGGGVARAICYGLKKNGCRVIVCSRKEEQAKDLWLKYGLDAYSSDIEAKTFEPFIFINATPLGTRVNDESVIFHKLVPSSTQVILDVVFKPQLTPLNILAKTRGWSFVSGWDMLIHQAIYQVDLFAKSQLSPLFHKI
ncbi:MAG: glycosyltransferase family 9 protein [Candidatus Thorarchaeota archaeon]